ncbi:hypothetical protein BD779DRAFT_330513 [Infundibulicybe gibba]|nr:hypothetical protein BD779DRAFT_330513 [Infundibulicybe gibba]
MSFPSRLTMTVYPARHYTCNNDYLVYYDILYPKMSPRPEALAFRRARCLDASLPKHVSSFLASNGHSTTTHDQRRGSPRDRAECEEYISPGNAISERYQMVMAEFVLTLRVASGSSFQAPGLPWGDGYDSRASTIGILCSINWRACLGTCVFMDKYH